VATSRDEVDGSARKSYILAAFGGYHCSKAGAALAGKTRTKKRLRPEKKNKKKNKKRHWITTGLLESLGGGNEQQNATNERAGATSGSYTIRLQSEFVTSRHFKKFPAVSSVVGKGGGLPPAERGMKHKDKKKACEPAKSGEVLFSNLVGLENLLRHS